MAEAEKTRVTVVGEVQRCGSDWITEGLGGHLRGSALNLEGDENH